VTLEFSRRIFPQISNFTKIRPVGAELFHADGQTDSRTDVTKLIVAFRNFANAPTNESTAYIGRRSRISNIPTLSTETDFHVKEKIPTACSWSQISLISRHIYLDDGGT
jgi:hypothetical protein